jgi:hypothetical protein
MATFGWAYINCEDSGSGGQAAGPDGSLQFLTGTNTTSGSARLVYYTSSYAGNLANTLILTGTLIVTGTISASHFHIEDVAIIDSTGSTYFGNSSDDVHVRTGSLYLSGDSRLGDAAADTHIVSGSWNLYGSTGLDVSYAASTSILTVPGVKARYTQVTAQSTTGSASDYIIGIRAGDINTDYRLPSASVCGSGSLRVLKDEEVSRSGTKIYISASSGDNIDGVNTYTLSGTLSAINLYSDGSLTWFIF